jgi:predicted nucleotidyltransferase
MTNTDHLDTISQKDAVDSTKKLQGLLPSAIQKIVTASAPLEIVLYGSLARGTDGPNSDIDLLVVFEQLNQAERKLLLDRCYAAISGKVDVTIADLATITKYRDTVGSLFYWTQRDGKVVYTKPGATKSVTDPYTPIILTPSEILAEQLLEATKWLDRAKGQLESIKKIQAAQPDMMGSYFGYSAFNASQLALKAGLVYYNTPFRKTYDLAFLVSQLPAALQEKFDNLDLNQLQKWSDNGWPLDDWDLREEIQDDTIYETCTPLAEYIITTIDGVVQ